MRRNIVGLAAALVASLVLSACTESNARNPGAMAKLDGRWKSAFITEMAAGKLQPCRDAYMEFRGDALYIAGKAKQQRMMTVKSVAEKDGLMHLVVRDDKRGGRDMLLVLNVGSNHIALDDARDATGKMSLKNGLPGLPASMSNMMSSVYEMLDRIFTMDRCS